MVQLLESANLHPGASTHMPAIRATHDATTITTMSVGPLSPPDDGAADADALAAARVPETDELGAEKVLVCVIWTTVGCTVDVGRTVVTGGRLVSGAGVVIVAGAAVLVTRITPGSRMLVITPPRPPPSVVC